MSFNKFTPINKLNPSKIKWKIRVRAQAVWRGITRETKEFRGINLILVDDSKFRIHAFVNARFAQLFEDKLEEGQIYEISNFIVQEYTGIEFHRCVRYDKHIYFADYTKLEKSISDGLKIPTFAFDFFNLMDLANMEADKRFLCDVVGVIRDKPAIRDYVNDNQEQKAQKKLTITDGRCSIKVTFFDKFAEQVEEALNNETSEPIIIIIASAKIGSFQGELNLTNYPATRIYLNSNHKAVHDLKIRAKATTFFKDLPILQEKSPDIMSISEIKKLNEAHIEKKFTCQVTVKKVEENLHWYDNICLKCDVEVHIEDGRYRCSKCRRSFVCPQRRFRICTFCCDSTGGLPIILGDREVQRITGMTAFDIGLHVVEGDEDKFPQVLKTIQNQKFKITVMISKENANKESDVYEACDIAMEGDENYGSSTPMSETYLEAKDDTSAMETPVGNTDQQMITPDSRASLTKRRVRKSPHASENIATTKLSVKTVKIKKEKVTTKTSKPKKSPKTKKPIASVCQELSQQQNETQSENSDDQITLSNFQKRKK